MQQHPPTLYGGDHRRLTQVSNELVCHSLSLLGISYVVRHHERPWWRGAACSPVKVKVVLKNISLLVQSGELTALLGNSGSGKTSLLDVVACRGSGQTVGAVYLNNQLLTNELFRIEAGYVIQDDRLLPNLTVKETLFYVAKLKFANAPYEAINERVETIMADLKVRHLADCRIGSTLIRGISGGEKRRVSIATQLLQDPKILLLDEPTTGLDSCTANHLVALLGELAKKKNKIIMMSIHQPSSDIFHRLDQIGLLCEGELVYMGSARQLVPHFTNIGHPCPQYANPLDHYVDLGSIDHRSAQVEAESRQRMRKLKTAFMHAPSFRATLAEIHDVTRMADYVEPVNSNPLGIPSPPGYLKTLGTLVDRMMVNLVRNRISLGMRCFQLTSFSFFMWLYLIQLQHNQESIQDRIGLLYQSGQVPAYVGLLNCVALYPVLRELYGRESQDGLYGPLVFLNAYFVHVLPFALFSGLLFATINYWALGMMPGFGRYGIYVAVVFMMHYCGELMAVMFMGFVRSPDISNSVVALILAITGLLSSGLLRSIQNMPVVLQYLGYATIFKYSSEIFMANEFQDLNLTCSEDSNTRCLFQTGDQFLTLMYPEAVDNMTRNFGCMAAFVLGYVLFAIIIYKAVSNKVLH